MAASTETVDLAHVEELLAQLQANLKDARSSLQQQEQLLSKVKLASRQPTLAGRLGRRETISLLSQYGFKHGRSAAAKEALRCLANNFFLNELSRETFVQLGNASLLADRLAESDADEEFLCARLLFLLTYSTSVDLTDLVERHQLAVSMVAIIEKHAKTAETKKSFAPNNEMGLTEVLRLLFNVQHFAPALQNRFTAALPGLSTILTSITWPGPVMQPTLSAVINAFLNMDLGAAMQHAGQQANRQAVVTSLTNVLDRATTEHSEAELETAAAPLCTLLRKICESADSDTKQQLRQRLLPTSSDRETPLGQGDAFSARLLRMTTSANLPLLRTNISCLLFELSESDPEQFVRNVGYGYASGFLMSQNIPVPVGDAADRSENLAEVNPITGQRIDAEDTTEVLPEMTDEEKEREAERLFVLFERLKATGVVDVKNPVEEYRDSQ